MAGFRSEEALIGLIALVWFVMKRIQRSRYPALEEKGPALVDVVTSQDAVSSDATKGLGFVPDYQALTPWNDAELKRRR